MGGLLPHLCRGSEKGGPSRGGGRTAGARWGRKPRQGLAKAKGPAEPRQGQGFRNTVGQRTMQTKLAACFHVQRRCIVERLDGRTPRTISAKLADGPSRTLGCPGVRNDMRLKFREHYQGNTTNRDRANVYTL